MTETPGTPPEPQPPTEETSDPKAEVGVGPWQGEWPEGDHWDQRKKRERMSPLEQIAYDAFVKLTKADTPEARREVLRAWNEWRAVKDGRAEPLPQYRAR